MQGKREKLLSIRGSKQRGFSTLEYCAGAAVICGIVWGAMSGLSGNMSSFLQSIGSWVSDRQGEISSSGQGGGGNGGGNSGPIGTTP